MSVRTPPLPLRRFVAFALLLVCAPLAAQDTTSAPPLTAPPSPIDELIARVRADVNDLRYADAVRRGHDTFAAFGSQLRPAQVIALRSAMAAAFYPEEAQAQRPDSALAYLTMLVQAQPDVRLPIELRWDGLDSLLGVARTRTFAVVMRPSDSETLIGTDGRGFVEVVSSRPATYRLRITGPMGAPVTLHDSTSTPEERSRLSFRAHDGRSALLSSGTYEFAVTAVDATGDSVTVRHRGEVTGSAPQLATLPVFDTTKIVRPTSKPRRVMPMLSTVFFAASTIGIATAARAEEPIRSAFGTDGRATLVAVAMIGAAVGSWWLDRGVHDPEIVKSNIEYRDAFRRQVSEVTAGNRDKVAAYRVTVRIEPEARR